jgi:hypothetical protein
LLKGERHFHIERIAEAVSEFAKGFGFNLANSFAGQTELFSDFL